MGFIELTQIQKTERCITSFESEIIGKIAISKDLLRNAIIMENNSLAPPKNFGQGYAYSYTSKIFFPCSEKCTTILVAEQFETILEDLKEK